MSELQISENKNLLKYVKKIAAIVYPIF
jgi:hypothetical protein